MNATTSHVVPSVDVEAPAALVEQVRTRLGSLGREYRPDDVASCLRELGAVVSDRLILLTLDQLRTSSVGAGPLEALLQLPGVTDVLVNGSEQVYIDRGAGLERVPSRFESEEQVRALATRLAASVGRRLDEASPWVDARLGDGTRVHAVLGALADPGTCISLRVPSRRTLTLAGLRAAGAIGPVLERVLAALIESRAAFLVSGGTGTGKTTLLAALLSRVPADERIVVVEDSRELRPSHPHVVRLEGRVANTEGAGSVTLTDLVRQGLRMRPDRLVLGEARGAEVRDLLQALNTGHEGGCGTIHANSVTDVPARLEALASLGGMDRPACHAQVSSALRVAVHLVRGGTGRRVAQIGLFVQRDGWVRVEPALLHDAAGSERPAGAWPQLCEALGLDARELTHGAAQ